MSDPNDDFEELPPGRYEGTVERIRYYIETTITIIITYKLNTPNGVRRVKEEILIQAPKSSRAYFKTTRGWGRVEDILRTQRQAVPTPKDLNDLPPLLEGLAVAVVTRHERVAGFNVPKVVRIEAI
jgi:hypothetical protein